MSFLERDLGKENYLLAGEGLYSTVRLLMFFFSFAERTWLRRYAGVRLWIFWYPGLLWRGIETLVAKRVVESG